MKKLSYMPVLILAALLLSSFPGTAKRRDAPMNAAPVCVDADCSDPWGGCKQKVKVVSRNGDCVTFACQVGTKDEHIIKTSNQEGQKALFKIIEEQEEVE